MLPVHRDVDQLGDRVVDEAEEPVDLLVGEGRHGRHVLHVGDVEELAPLAADHEQAEHRFLPCNEMDVRRVFFV